MSRHLTPRRLALAASAALLSGCIFLTPPTGVRLGDHSKEFDHLQAGGLQTGQVEFNKLDSSDFSLLYPNYWSVSSPDPAQQAQGLARLTIGVRTPQGQAEGLFMTIFNAQLDADATKANELLAEKLKSDLKATSKTYTEIKSETATLSGQPAYKLEAKVTDADGVESHMLGYTTVYGGRSYILMFTAVPEDRFQTIVPLFLQLAREFKFKDPATGSPVPGPTPDPNASPAPSASPSASASPAP